MKFNPDLHHRRTIRLKGYNYSQPGSYFVTICSWRVKCILGDIVNRKMQLNKNGEIVEKCWEWLSNHYQYVQLDEWVIMPNHLHGIVVISGDDCRGGSRTAPTDIITHKPLGRLIGAFKTVSTKRINQIRNISALPIWQRNYYEHIIRNENGLNRIREYIINNPLKWEEDENNPVNIKQIALSLRSSQ